MPFTPTLNPNSCLAQAKGGGWTKPAPWQPGWDEATMRKPYKEAASREMSRRQRLGNAIRWFMERGATRTQARLVLLQHGPLMAQGPALQVKNKKSEREFVNLLQNSVFGKTEVAKNLFFKPASLGNSFLNLLRLILDKCIFLTCFAWGVHETQTNKNRLI